MFTNLLNESLSGIIQQFGLKFESSDNCDKQFEILKTTAINHYGEENVDVKASTNNILLSIYYPEITITSDVDDDTINNQHTIQEVYVDYSIMINTTNDNIYISSDICINRTKFTSKELMHGYVHSHINTSVGKYIKNNIIEEVYNRDIYQSLYLFCLGGDDIRNIFLKLTNEGLTEQDFVDQYAYFFNYVDVFLTKEHYNGVYMTLCSLYASSSYNVLYYYNINRSFNIRNNYKNITCSVPIHDAFEKSYIEHLRAILTTYDIKFIVEEIYFNGEYIEVKKFNNAFIESLYVPLVCYKRNNIYYKKLNHQNIEQHQTLVQKINSYNEYISNKPDSGLGLEFKGEFKRLTFDIILDNENDSENEYKLVLNPHFENYLNKELSIILTKKYYEHYFSKKKKI